MAFNKALAERQPALRLRATVINVIRHYFIEEGYLEVETPLRIPAPAPESYIDAVPSREWFLQTSPELCMKRMLAAGYERLFQISHCWRDAERGSLHLPEFTMLEWYRAHADYLALMDDCEDLVRRAAMAIGLGDEIRFKGKNIDLGGTWERICVREAYQRYGPTSMEKALEEDRFDEIMVEAIEPKLGLDKPVFLHDYPAKRSALAQLKASDPTVSERFELYIGGLEIANAFTELTDAEEQQARFLEEAESRRCAGKAIYPSPVRFLEELPAMPPAAGIALGVDRLLMVLLDKTSIEEVVAFTPEEL